MDNAASSLQTSAKIMAYYEKYMLFVGVFGQLLYYIQAVKIFLLGSAEGVSVLAFLLGFISVSSWLVYGYLINNKILVISNLIAVFGALLVLAGIFIYG